jgi:hypothetical protein
MSGKHENKKKERVVGTMKIKEIKCVCYTAV